MTYSEAIDFLFTRLPMYQRSGSAAYKDNLDNTWRLDEWFGHPHRAFKSIHVAGTNGKGSVSHMLASVLQSAGYRTGLYTSPHLVDFRERIRIDGGMIPQEKVVDFVMQNQAVITEIAPSFFEMTVAMAFDYFSRERVEVAVIETGLGGRLDSTNIVDPVLSIITNIGLDHTALLGPTLPLIAAEKAGIIKKDTPVVIGRRQQETRPVFEEKARAMKAPLLMADEALSVLLMNQGAHALSVRVLKNGHVFMDDLVLPLPGNYQLENLRTVLASVEELVRQGFEISEMHLRSGMAGVVANTGLRGRWQILSSQPLTICDTGHNEDGMRMIVEQIKALEFNCLHFVLGMVSDKEVDPILALLPTHARYYFTRANIPRSLDPELLQKKALVHGLSGQIFANVPEAWRAAQKNAGDNDLIFIGGSTFVVAEVV
ncbi:dihydrofolate synthase [Geofilum rubicundum JCM 15548]|uniref:Dihydrofolate synthase/folylpolyglutamate synthase n=2 Tax=Geofilum TaxID=1236988 RepID=A0A0E9LSC4_9BACT|nr:dihydrofolate synthase [Geofilum rubicundum JCM 15548]